MHKALCYTGAMHHAEPLDDLTHLTARLERWAVRLRARRLDSVAGALLDAAEPLGPFGAQLLWIVQPALGLIAPRHEIATLARVLEEPGGVAWLRDRIAGADEKSQYE